ERVRNVFFKRVASDIRNHGNSTLRIARVGLNGFGFGDNRYLFGRKTKGRFQRKSQSGNSGSDHQKIGLFHAGWATGFPAESASMRSIGSNARLRSSSTTKTSGC